MSCQIQHTICICHCIISDREIKGNPTALYLNSFSPYLPCPVDFLF
ncbi:hypothetical protein [Clostridium phage Saumur]|nr:hypothetical protein [Clostridium phage Saumur]